MRKVIICSIIVFGLVFGSGVAFAQLPNNIYIGGGIGYFALTDIDLGETYNAGAYPMLVGEISDIYEGIGLKSTVGYYYATDRENADKKIILIPWNISVIYSLTPKEPMSIYVGAGVVNYMAYEEEPGIEYLNHEANPGYHILAGVDLSLSQELKVSLEILDNFVQINKGAYEGDPQDFGSLVATVGVAYNLTPPPPPAPKPRKPKVAPPPKIKEEKPVPSKPKLEMLEEMRLRKRLTKINTQLKKEEVFISKMKWRLENEKMTPQKREEIEKILKFHEDVVEKLEKEKAEILQKLE